MFVCLCLCYRWTKPDSHPRRWHTGMQTWWKCIRTKLATLSISIVHEQLFESKPVEQTYEQKVTNEDHSFCKSLNPEHSKANNILISCLIHLKLNSNTNKVRERARGWGQIESAMESGTVTPESGVAHVIMSSAQVLTDQWQIDNPIPTPVSLSLFNA